MNYDLPSWMSMKNLTPHVRLTLPPAYFFKVPPSDFPRTLPPPSDHPTLAHPFTIPIDIYNAALSPNVPILAALGYATVITFLNGVNERRRYKPWAFSKTRFFKLMVITHNIILAVYSAWTFVGMVNALRTSFYPPWEEYGLAGTLDSLCKIHGPRGPGSAAVPGESTTAWSVTNHLIHLGADGLTPESTDVGRIWNQGLAFYGWLFYLSKFYEVIDTLIIIAKGKKSSFLQTYHHAGAMLCMWAGMRYMSAPIWMFVLVNSFIHSIMYTFYLCSAIRVRVPVWFKRTLTTLQITQFVVGASYAFAHLFIKYQSPVSVPYLYHLGNVLSDAATDASSTASSAFAAATAVATDDWPALLKKLALRAAGREGLAQNVYDHSGHTFGVDATKAVQDYVAREETRYRNDLQWTNCLDTSGQAFAVMLNVVYLLPLTWLFANFFIQSYLRRVERRRSSTASQKAQLARESVSDAAKRSGRRLSQAFEDPQAGFEDTGDEAVIFDGEKIKNKIDTTASKVKKETNKAASNAKETLSNTATNVQKESSKLSSKAERKAEESISRVKSESSQVASKVKEEAGPVTQQAKQGMATTLDNLKAQADSLKVKAQENIGADLEYVKDGYERTKTAISSMITGRDGQEQSGGADDEAQESSVKESDQADESAEEGKTGSSSRSAKADRDTNTRDDTSHDDDSTLEESISKSSEVSQTDEEDGKQSTVAGKGTNEKAEELSPKEKVQQQDSKSKTKAEASTGDAKKDDSPAKQSTKQDLNRKAQASPKKSNKENRNKQDTGVKGSKGKDVSNEKISGEATVEKAAASTRETASNVASSVQETIENPPPAVKDAAKKTRETASNVAGAVQDTVKNPSPVVKDAADKAQETASNVTGTVQDTVQNPPTVVKDAADKAQGYSKKAQRVASKTLETSSQKLEQMSESVASSKQSTSGQKDAAEGQEHDDQKESWIHIPQTPEKEAGKAKKSNKRETSASDKNKASESKETPARPASPEWFEKLTSGIDSPSKVKRDAEKEDKVIDESEALRDNVVDETSKGLTKHTTSGNKQEQDKIIDESEVVRTKPVKQKKGSSASDSKNDSADKPAAISKEEQDKIIDESEPVRDDVKDVEAGA